MGFFDLYWNLQQQRDISDARNTIRGNQTEVESLRSSVEELRTTVYRLALLNQALWELVSEKTGMSDEELKARVEQIDLRDGVRDGRIGGETRLCPHCYRPNKPSRQRCLYCDKALE